MVTSPDPRVPRDWFTIEAADGSTPELRVVGRFARARRGDAEIIVQGRILRLSADEPRLSDRPGDEVAGLLLERWLERGEGCLPAVLGDFLACRVDPRGVAAFKPLTSQYQLYFTDGAASNRLLPLAHRLGASDLDPDYLMRLLMVTPGIQHSLPATPFRGVRRLRPWHLLRMEAGRTTERPIASRRYRYEGPPGQRVEGVAPEITRLMTESVEDRLASPTPRTVSCEVSGGLDSSFVAALAGRARSAGVDGPVRGVMFSWPDKPSHRFGEEAARAVADRWGLALSVVPPEELGDGDLSETRTYADEPSDFFWYGPLFGDWAARNLPDESLVLTGYASDALFMRTALVLPFLLGHGDVAGFRRVLADLGRVAQRSQVSLALQAALALLPRPVYLKLATPFSGRRLNPFEVLDIQADWHLREPISWLRADPRELVATQERFDAEGRAADEALIGSTVVRDDSISWIAHHRMVVGPWYDPKRVEDQSPFIDLRVMDRVWGQTRWELIHDFRSPYKHLLREAQRHIVPEIVRARQHDTFFFDGFRAGVIRRNEHLLRDLLAGRGPAADVLDDRFDREALSRTLDELVFGRHSSSIRSLYVLLGYLLWWRDFRESADRFS